MADGTDRILTTHAGSLPRPKSLAALHAARFGGRQVDTSELAVAAEEATRQVIARQLAAGIDIGNNGEVGRESFFTYVQHRMTGFGGTSERALMRDVTRYPGYLERLVQGSRRGESVSLLRGPKAIAEIRYIDAPTIGGSARRGSAIDDECSQLARLLAENEKKFTDVFVSAPSPGIIAAAMQNEFYDSLGDYVDALAAALRTEYQAIVRHGFLLQIDAPDLAMERHTLFADKPLADFLDFGRVVIAALDRALADVPRERVRLHVCWGNYEGPHDLDVGLEEIWEVIAALEVGGVLLSMANPRHAHEFRCFERLELPPGVSLIPGVIDTTTNYVEHPLTVAERIERVARAIGDPRRVLAGTDCGFETAAGMSPVEEEIAWAKLRSLVEGARIASSRLFGRG